MKETLAKLDAGRILRLAGGGLGGRCVAAWSRVGSTNSVARELARRGAPEGTAVLAAEQSAGRGRGGRRWHSPAGKGLYLSLVLRPPAELLRSAPGLLPLLASLAVVRALEPVMAGRRLEIQWPNDVLGGEAKKIAGSLAEGGGLDRGGRPFVVLGTGINVNQESADFLEELRPLATSVLLETGQEGDLSGVAGGFLAAVDRLYHLLLRGGGEEMLALWKGYSRSHIGWRVRVEGGGPEVEGRTDGLNGDGSLRVVLGDGRTVDVLAGEVKLLGRAGRE